MSGMTFTDDDLRRMKNTCAQIKAKGHTTYLPRVVELDALLARLEAAERYIKATWGVIDIGPGLIRDEIIESYKAWREAKGE